MQAITFRMDKPQNPKKSKRQKKKTKKTKKKHMHPYVHCSTITIAKTWRQPECPLTDEWIKMWYIYTIEYYSAMKRRK